MAEKKQTLTTRRMPSGAQQYTREGRRSALIGGNTPPQRRMRMIDDLIRRHPEAEPSLHEAFMDEARLGRAAIDNEVQALEETSANRRRNRFASGGAVRGTRPVQVSGKGFSGSY